jgi:lysine-N-methylase
MPMPVRHLPVVQNWDCQGCTDCCHEYSVHVTAEERERISAQGWENREEFRGVPLFVHEGSWRRETYRLNHRENGACVFLGEGGRCRIHAEFGSAAKPLACRVYPFMLVPAGDHWRVGLRFACPSAARSVGRPLRDHTDEIREYVAGLEQQARAGTKELPPPALQGRQKVSWPDLFTFTHGLGLILSLKEDRIERRLRKCLALADLCRKAKFDKVTGKRLEEFLGIVIGALNDEVPTQPEQVPPPTWVGRVIFRQILALYSRKDRGPYRGNASRSRWRLLKAAVACARGTGAVPQLNALLPDTTFEKLEEPAGPLPPESEDILERYFLVKVHSFQFAGLTNFNCSFWDGFESLALSFPIAMWLARAYSQMPRPDAVVRGLRIADDSFGFHPVLGTRRQKLGQNILSFRGEIPRLVAWYAR